MAIGLGLLGGGKVVDRTGVGTHALVVGDGFGGATAALAGADGSLDAVLGGGDCGITLLLKCPRRRSGLFSFVNLRNLVLDCKCFGCCANAWLLAFLCLFLLFNLFLRVNPFGWPRWGHH